ncbi:MAG: hypothetical protein OZ921_15325 [Sorangiineae bacterium]|nr:hypothetical protein [Polyangiaceae bacterium]MEB2323882.1 hypothetical protein [Sorangiineae bacterium]
MIPAFIDPRNSDLPDGDPNKYVPDAAAAYFGAGTYRVTRPFTYARKEHLPGDVVTLGDAAVGRFFDCLEHLDPAVEQERGAKARAIAEASVKEAVAKA